MKVLFDTNVVLDLLLDRAPFSGAAASLMALVENGQLDGVLGATTITTLHYLVLRSRGDDEARLHIRNLLRLFQVAPVTRAVLESALDLPFSDFEDAVLHEAGRSIGASAIVTRNQRDFRPSTLAIYAPVELLVALAEAAEDPS